MHRNISLFRFIFTYNYNLAYPSTPVPLQTMSSPVTLPTSPQISAAASEEVTVLSTSEDLNQEWPRQARKKLKADCAQIGWTSGGMLLVHPDGSTYGTHIFRRSGIPYLHVL